MGDGNLKAYAKINLTLNVLKKLPLGYHEIESVMHQVQLSDDISIKKIEKGIVIKCNNPKVPLDEGNTVYKAAELLKNRYDIKEGVEITIEKNIPISGGLSGGSTDAGAVLMLMNDLFDLLIEKDDLMDFGAEIGMDVPFSILGGAAVAKGMGEVLEKIENIKMNILLINHGVEVSTKEAYENLNLEECGKTVNTNKILNSIKEKNIKKTAESLYNDFENTIIKKYPIIDKIKKDLIDEGALNALMSGSGATVFGVFENEEKAKAAFENLNGKYDFVWVGKTR